MDRIVKSLSLNMGRLLLTLSLVAAALLVGWRLWDYYMDEPWTRDARLRADVVQVTPDVSGLVDAVPVRDNQLVKAGDILFRVDLARFDLALRQAQANVAARKASLDQAVRNLARDQTLVDRAVPRQKLEETETAAAQAREAYNQAVAERDIAQLNLDRATVRAPVNGRLSNFELRPGDYVTAGKGVAALVDTDSFYVAGYFEETKLSRIKVGDPVSISLMGESILLKGHVESIASGIIDRENVAGSNLLANVNPTFSWVRLAQRVPVRIALDAIPDPAWLISGRTATVHVRPDGRVTTERPQG